MLESPAFANAHYVAGRGEYVKAEERFSIWDSYKERVRELFIDVESDLDWKFAPYRFENGKLVEADKDTPEMKKLFDLLADLDAFVERNFNRAHAEYSEWEDEQLNLQHSFEAWCLGFCPAVMKNIPNMHMPELGQGYAYDAIAKLRQVSGISKKDTEHAGEVWKAHRRLHSMACALVQAETSLISLSTSEARTDDGHSSERR